jgi:hypothetical protein
MPTSKELDLQLKKTVISAESFKKTGSFDVSKNIVSIHKTISNLAGHVRKVVIRVGDLEKRVNNNSKKITSLKNISALQGPQIRGTNIGAKLPGSAVQEVDKNIADITKSVISIADILAGEKKLTAATSAYEKRKAEQEKRGLAESKLEKRFEGLKRIAERIIAPVKSLLDRIIEFFTKVIFGRIVYKLVEWMGDPKNTSKVKSIIRFVKDWWPALLGSYILFGTSFGGLVRGLTGMVGRFIFQLGRVAIPQLLRVIARNPIATLAIAGGIGAYAASQQNKEKRDQFAKTDKSIVKPEETAKGGRKPGAAQLQQEQVLQRGFGGMFSGGGLLRGFSGGGFASGYVSGEKGVDKVPAMLSDGEFVMSRGAVEKYGVDTLEAMNAAGGGTNKPKMINGKTYAAGGGPIGRDPVSNIKDFIKYKIGYDVDRPETWGQSFSAGFSGRSGFDFNKISRQLTGVGSYLQRSAGSQIQGDGQQAITALSNISRSKIPSQEEMLQFGSNIAGRVGTLISGVNPLPQVGRFFETANLPFENQALNYEKSLKLAPGEGLTAENKKKDEDLKKRIREMYDPDRDKGIHGSVKKQFKDLVNRGAIPEWMYSPLTAALKTETSDKIISKLTGGKVNHLSAALTGLQYVGKGFLGPLGRPFQIDTQGLGRYQRSLMLEAQRGGHGSVGARALGQEKYNRMQDESMGSHFFAKLANYALGQNVFTVDKRGRATTTDTWDSSNKDIKGYIQSSKQGLKYFGQFLQGKNPQGYKGLEQAAFMGASGLLRMMQNTPWANLHPGGVEVDLGGGFKPTDSSGKVLSKERLKRQEQQRLGGGSVKLYDKPQKNTGQPYQSRFSRPRNAGVRPVNPPSKPSVKVVRTKANTIGNGKGGGRPSSSRTPNFSASTRGSRSKANTLGIPNQASYR